MATGAQRIAINSGGGYVPGINAVVVGAVLAANKLGWEIVGIRDGYDGLLVDDNDPEGGLINLSPQTVENLTGTSGSIIGTASRHDPFRMRTVNASNFVEEVDRSDELLEKIRARKIDAVISIVGGSALTGAHALSVAFKLSRKGLRTVCVPKSVENDVAATALSFGYNSVLSYTTETLERIRTAARDVHRMHDHEGAERSGFRPQRLERRIIEILALHVRADHGAAQAERAHGATKLLGGTLRRLHR